MNIDTSELKNLIDEAKKKNDISKYTADSLKDLSIQIENSDNLISSEDITQEKINLQKELLNKSIERLIELKKDGLIEKIKLAKSQLEKLNIYSKDSIDKLKLAVKESEDILNNKTPINQDKIDSQVNKLENIIKNLKPLKYSILVKNGKSNISEAKSGETVFITAEPAPEGKVFDKWVVNKGDKVEIKEPELEKTEFIMTHGDVEIEAYYRELPKKIVPLESISITTSSALTVGKTSKISVKYLPENATNKKIKTWKSSDESIAMVKDGIVEGIKEGKVIITAIADENDIKAECEVVVEKLLILEPKPDKEQPKEEPKPDKEQPKEEPKQDKEQQKEELKPDKEQPKEESKSDKETQKQNDNSSLNNNASSSSVGGGGGGYTPSKESEEKAVKEKSKEKEVQDSKKAKKVENKKEEPSKEESVSLSENNEIKILDVNANHWAKKYIDNMVKKGVMIGDKNGNFNPNNKITRAEIAQVVYNLSDDKTIDNIVKLKDVEDKKWYTNAINFAVSNKYFSGYKDNSFKPSNKITRIEFISVMVKFNKLELVSDDEADKILSKYTDKNLIPSWAKINVATLVKSGIIVGNDNKINALSEITRAEVAAILSKLNN